MIVLQTFTEGPEPCAYLTDRMSTLEYEYVLHISPAEYEERMNAGWRKFGALMFRPVCEGCTECRPIRIPVATFEPDRSQQRTARRCADLEIRFGRPTVDRVRLDLYHRYHDAQTQYKGWPAAHRTAEEYRFAFVENPVPSVEITVWEGSDLRAVVLTDVTPRVVSGIYHYHDPDMRERGLGTFSMLQTIELARRLEKRWAYFGYYVAGCGSMSYKSRFQPCELLSAAGQWRVFAAGSDLKVS